MLKKLISNFVHLVPGIFLFMLLFWVLRAWWPRVSNTAILVGLIALIALSSPPISNRLVLSLETKYEVLHNAPEDTALILVLADGHIWEENRPSNVSLKAIGLSRLTEGVRLWKTHDQALLATSGEKFNSPHPHAKMMNDFALDQGVTPERTLQFPTTRDTQGEVNAAIEFLNENDLDGRKRIVVVSSAVHLPRIELMLQEQNALYTMAPTDFIALGAPWHRFNGYFLENANRAMHEYVGIVWHKLLAR